MGQGSLAVRAYAGGALAAACAAVAASTLSASPVWLALPTAVAIYLAFRACRCGIEQERGKAQQISELHLATIEALALAIDAKDQTTHCHVRRLQVYAAGMGEVFGLSPDDIAALNAGALLHDVGKLAVPSHILNKPGRLTPAEFERMKVHTVVGAQILSRVNFPYPVIPIIRHHHEQWDGRGYPDQLKGEEIPLTARILAVVDCFDSIREDRPFRRGMTSQEAIALLQRGAGNHFDPQVVELFLENLPRFEADIRSKGLEHQPARDKATEPIKLSDIDLSQTRERGSCVAYDVIKQANREVYALYEIARTFGTSLKVEQTLEILVDKVAHVVPFDTCAVYFYDESKGHATVRHVVGKNAELINARRIVPGEGVTGFALSNRMPVKQLHPSLDFTDVKTKEELK